MATYSSNEPLVIGPPGAPELRYGAVDPAAGAGVPAPIGSLYNRTDTGTIYSKTGAADTDWTAIGGGAGGTVNELWAPRITPHAEDDEFDHNDTALPGWTQTGFTALSFATRPAPYVAAVTNRASYENLRDPDNTTDPSQNSWLRIQPGGGLAGLWKSIDFGAGVPTNLFVWARMRFAWTNATSPGSGGVDIGMSFFEDSGAGFSFAVHATMNLSNTQEGAVGSVVKPLFWGRNGGVPTTASEGTRQNATTSNRSDYSFYSGYLGLQKAGNTYYGWLFDDGGRLCFGAYTDAGLAGINAFAIWCRANSLTTQLVPLFDVDFVRFYEGTDWIP